MFSKVGNSTPPRWWPYAAGSSLKAYLLHNHTHVRKLMQVPDKGSCLDLVTNLVAGLLVVLFLVDSSRAHEARKNWRKQEDLQKNLCDEYGEK